MASWGSIGQKNQSLEILLDSIPNFPKLDAFHGPEVQETGLPFYFFLLI